MSEERESTSGLYQERRRSFGPLIFPWGSGSFYWKEGPLMTDLRVFPSLISGIHIRSGSLAAADAQGRKDLRLMALIMKMRSRWKRFEQKSLACYSSTHRSLLRRWGVGGGSWGFWSFFFQSANENALRIPERKTSAAHPRGDAPGWGQSRDLL